MTLLLIGHNLFLTPVNLNSMPILYVINFVQTIPSNQNVLIKIMQKPQYELYNELSANLQRTFKLKYYLCTEQCNYN